MSGLIRALLQLNFIPRNWLTILSGFAALLVGVGSAICAYTGICETPMTQAETVTMISGGLVAIGLGRRKQ